ncbi:wax ester/triacylglycerol synthase domain-containing protein [Pedococcus sp. 5OH_020]|uniref:wax ester/triacylglycerol synthase domain-containing protein n=1 Tax=Pedococcus sp. 5OH_020 TaxID=2989814 RepID=UPI0022EA00A1|nr:wax ester/triacylglycerol synthase domain-containing protein [Pedococcus sp. 5OH_020]
MSHYLADLVAPLDALLLKGDADPSTRAIMSSVLVLKGVPDATALEEAFERASNAVPRMRQRVCETGVTRPRQTWVPDDSFEARGHIRWVGAPGDRSLTAVLEMASTFATTPFDSAKPLWDVTVVTGVKGGRAVVLLRVHHAVADGLRTVEMMANLLDTEPHPTRGEAPTPPDPRRSALRTAGERWVRTTSQLMSIRQGRADSMTRWAMDASWRPVRTLSDAGQYARSVLRTYGSSGAEPSPLLRSRSRERTFAVLEVPLASMRSVARTKSATVNDVFITALLGGLRAYHERSGAPVLDIPVAFPINVSRDAAQRSGNHFSAGVIPGPCSVSDPRERLRLVHELVVARREEPGVDAPLRLAPLVHHVPSRLATVALGAYARRVDLQASNIMGPQRPLYLAGVPIERFYGFGPLPGIPIMAVMVSYDGTCTVGFTIDPASVTDVGLFMDCVDAAFDELGVRSAGG